MMTQFITRNKNCVYLLCLLLLLALPFLILVAVQSYSTATSKLFQVKLVVKNDKHPASKGSPRYHNGGQLTRRPSNEQQPSSRASRPAIKSNQQPKESNMPTSSVCKFGPDYSSYKSKSGWPSCRCPEDPSCDIQQRAKFSTL